MMYYWERGLNVESMVPFIPYNLVFVMLCFGECQSRGCPWFSHQPLIQRCKKKASSRAQAFIWLNLDNFHFSDLPVLHSNSYENYYLPLLTENVVVKEFKGGSLCEDFIPGARYIYQETLSLFKFNHFLLRTTTLNQASASNCLISKTRHMGRVII